MNIFKNDETRQNVEAGAKIIYDAVSTTMGPKGRNILIKDKFGAFTVTHDGVTVARAIQLKDDPKSIGVEIIKEASAKMDQTGDGTTSVTVLTYHLIKLANELIAKGENPMLVKRELEALIPSLVEKIKEKSHTIDKTADSVKNIATVSVGDEELGKQIAELMEKIGFDGAVSVEETQAPETTFKSVEGFSFDRGYASPYFVTNPASREAVLHNPAIILINGTVDNLELYKPIFDMILENAIKSVLIVAENFEADALGSLILNKVKNVLNIVAVKTPGYGDEKLENLRDMAAVTGGKVIDPSIGDWEDQLGINSLGAAEKVVVSFDETILIGGQGDPTERAEKLKKRVKKVKQDEKDALFQRVAKLNGKVGIIKVGGQTESEAAEKKYRIDDAVAAVKAAMKSGIVAGGGVTLRDIAVDYLMGSKVETMLGVSLCKPYDVLLENSGYDPTETFEVGQGINVITGEKVNTFDAGIIDPTEVTIEVVRNAITQACLAITVGGSIIDQQLTQEEMAQIYNMGN